MNKIYKLKFDKRRNELVVVSEITAGLGKTESTGHIAGLLALPFRKLLGTLSPLSLMTGLAMGILPMMVLAAPDLPAGGQIVGGQGSISVNGHQMTVHQNSQSMAASWSSFDIGKNNSVRFVQPDSSAVALNRVTGGHESRIMGSLSANGKVFLINPNGVLFGKGARVNTAGLVASTKNISTADFMKGKYTFSGGSGAGAEIINQGTLTTTAGGFIVLAADRVKNEGHIVTPSGNTVLAAADTVALQLDRNGLTSVTVNGSIVNALADNHGLISATDGQVYLTARGREMLLNTVVNNSGTVEAEGLTARGGIIRLDGGNTGVVRQSGQLLADSETGRGGRVTLEGQNIYLAGDSLTSATGKRGGGEVLVGGGWQGKDRQIKNASNVVMDRSATIDVSASGHGDGGQAVLWSEDYTNFRGTILAKGGRASGNGGQVETSSHNNLQAFGHVDASSPRGHGGNWLLDPTDVTIVGTGSESGISSSAAGSDAVFSPTASGAQILNTSIVNQLNAGTNVTVQTSGSDTDGQSGNITVNADIIKTAGADATLTLKADNNIRTRDTTSGQTGALNIGSSSGKLNLNLLAGNTTDQASVTLGAYTNISLNGGDFYAGAASSKNNISLVFSNNGGITAGNLTMDVAGGLSGYAFSLSSGNNLTINGPVTTNTGWGVTTNFSAENLLVINAGKGNLSFNATDTSRGGSRVVLSGKKGVDIQTAEGAISVQSSGGASTSAQIISDTGNVSIGAGGGLTLTNTNVSSGAGISLQAAGATTGMLKIQSSSLSTTGGGNITLDQKNHQLSAPDGSTTMNTNAMTVDILNSTLNAGDGDIRVEGYNPNVCLSAAAYTSTVRNGGIMVGVRNGSTLTGNNVSLNMELSGANASYLPVFINGATITAKNDINIGSSVNDGARPVQIEIRGSGNSLTAQAGNITLTNNMNGSSAAILLNGSGSRSDITLSALNGSLSLNGSSATGTGVSITSATLSAQRADIHGQSTDNNSTANGFSITNATLGGGLADLVNVTLSSSGSGAGVTNVLDSSVVTDANRDTLLGKSIDNMTAVDMNGTAIFNDSTQAWEKTYQTDAHPNAGWIFNNTTVNADSVNVTGVGFTNSSLNITSGDLVINNNGSVMLTNSVINALQGAVKANANGGGITLGAGSITAKGDINLQASNAVSMKVATVSSSAGGFTVNTTGGDIDLTSGNISVNKDINIHTPNGTVTLQGNNASAISDITSAAGNINITASVNKMDNTGVRFDNVNVSASAGEIHVYGENSGAAHQSKIWDGDLFGGVYFLNSVGFSAHKTTIDAVSSFPAQESTTRRLANPTALSFSGPSPVTLNISGDAVINASAQGGAGVMFNSRNWAAAKTTINLRNGNVIWTASTGDAILTDGKSVAAFTFSNTRGNNNTVYVNLEQANLAVIADASGAVRDKVSGFASAIVLNSPWVANGFIFSGTGNVSVTGKSSLADGINARVITNKDLNGTFSLQGESDSGVGVTLDGPLDAHLINASISGTSHSGIGVNISALKGKADLGNNEITGVSDTSAGIQIIGSNVTVTNGALTGRSGGAGAGVSLKGGSQYTFSGVNVTGQSVDGAGVSVSGNLAVNDQTTLNGTASG
ncbi:TPA: filamentous hemagglutinin N-terminal domain-containing protein, partial [Salmonella enterica subsp. enterica serovar Newport]